jgi:hypothetical protein
VRGEDAMPLRLKSVLKSLVRRIRYSGDSHLYVIAQVRKVLALKRHRQGRSDGLRLKRLKTISQAEKTTLHVEWIARAIHPWDRNRPPQSLQKLYTQQSLEDAQTAIHNLFDEIADVEAIAVRVFSSASEPPVMAGIVRREDLRRSIYDSPGMNLKTLGVSFNLNDWRLEPLAAIEDHLEVNQAHG